MKGRWSLVRVAPTCSVRSRSIGAVSKAEKRYTIVESALAAGLLLGGFVGCASTSTPNWLHPGTAQAQQARALRYDPYPENDSGSPLVGDRPREYDRPPPEPSRARWFLGNWGQ